MTHRPKPAAPLRVGLIGCGSIASQHLDAIDANPDAVLVAVADTDEDAAAAVVADRGVPGYPDLTRMLDAEQPDVVHICTPHHLHAPMAIECLRRGVHVLLEKPVARRSRTVKPWCGPPGASTATIGVCFQNRFNPTILAIRDLLEGGTLGDLVGGRAAVTWFRDESYYASRPWRGRWAESGGGVLINQAIHTLDLLQWFLGDVTAVRGVAARVALSDTIEVEDTAALQLGHAGGRGRCSMPATATSPTLRSPWSWSPNAASSGWTPMSGSNTPTVASTPSGRPGSATARKPTGAPRTGTSSTTSTDTSAPAPRSRSDPPRR